MSESEFFAMLKPFLSSLPAVIVAILYAAILLKKYVINGTVDRYFREERRSRRIMRKILTSLIKVENTQSEYLQKVAERRKQENVTTTADTK